MGEDGIDHEFKKCLAKGKLREFPKGKGLFPKELETAERDLEEAKDNYKNKKFKWATIQGYYAMFHTGRALIYFRGYRERSHYCLIVALRALFVSKRALSAQIVEMLQQGKRLRESADYYNEWSQEGARRIIESAEEFIKKTKGILRSE